MNQSTVFQAGTNTDPRVEIKLNVPALPAPCQEVLRTLGFSDLNGDGTLFLYRNQGRAIWIDNITDPGQIMPVICAAAEAIGERKRINVFRLALDLPLGIMDEANLTPSSPLSPS